MTIKQLKDRLKKKDLVNLRSRVVFEGKRKIILFEANAKSDIPTRHQSLTSLASGGTKRVHVGTFVPSTKRTFIFQESIGKFAKKKLKRGKK